MDFRELINKIDSINSEAKKEPERLAFDDAINHVKDIKFTPPLPSGIKFSSANNAKFKGQDINDPKVKLALFQDELKNSPARLLGEIGSRIKPSSDAQMDLSGHIAALGEKLANGSNKIGTLTGPEKELAVEAIKSALRGMELERDPDQSTYSDDDEDDANEMESVATEGDNIYHSCVKSFKHEKFGEGEVLHGEHTLSESGEVSHYDAKFVREDGSQFIVRNIPVANMKECVVVEHGHPKKKKKTEGSTNEGAVKKAMEDDAESMSKEEFMKKHGGPDADDEGASEFYDNYNGTSESVEDWFQGQTDVTLNGDEFYETFGWVGEDEEVVEAEYQGRTVKLNKPMRGDVKKFKVYVNNPKGNVVKVNFGDPDMRIKKSNPARRRSFRARHNCDNPGPKHKARYWSCKKW